jgi:hypothetical protein
MPNGGLVDATTVACSNPALERLDFDTVIARQRTRVLELSAAVDEARDARVLTGPQLDMLIARRTGAIFRLERLIADAADGDARRRRRAFETAA